MNELPSTHAMFRPAANPAPWSRPMTRSAAVTVRRPGASRDPAIRTRTWRQTAGVKEAAKGCIHAASTAGTLVGMAQAFPRVVAPRRLMSEEVVTMARRETWATPGDFGPLTLPLDEALEFVATEGFFWINA